MKIELLAKGKNQIQLIELIREYSEMDLDSAKEISESIPIEFIVNQSYNRIHEIISRFESIGCKVNIETGHTRKKKFTSSTSSSLFQKPSIQRFFSKEEKESSEKIKINTSIEAKDYLSNRQNFKKAIKGGIVASLILINILVTFFIVSSHQMNNNYSIWLYHVLIGLVIGFTIKKRGKGVLPKFGALSAGLTIFTGFAIIYVTYFVLIIQKGIWITAILSVKPFSGKFMLLPIAVSALMSYFSAFTKIKKVEKEDSLLYDLSDKTVSEYIEDKRNSVRKSYTSHQKYGKAIIPKTESKK